MRSSSASNPPEFRLNLMLLVKYAIVFSQDSTRLVRIPLALQLCQAHAQMLRSSSVASLEGVIPLVQEKANGTIELLVPRLFLAGASAQVLQSIAKLDTAELEFLPALLIRIHT